TLEVGLDGRIRRLDAPPTEIDPAWTSPDGSQVLELGGDRGDSELRVRDTGAGTSVALVATDPTRSRLTIVGWMPDGTAVLYYVVDRSIAHPLTAWIVERDGSNARPWGTYPDHSRIFGWSADRAWMLASDTARYVVAPAGRALPRQGSGGQTPHVRRQP